MQNDKLQRVLQAVAPPSPEPSPDEVTEGQSYAMIGRGRQVPGLDVVWADGRRDGFQYSQVMRRQLSDSKTTITLHVADFEPLKVLIEGRNLDALADLIREQRCCKIRVAGRDFEDGPVVTSVRFEVVKEEMD